MMNLRLLTALGLLAATSADFAFGAPPQLPGDYLKVPLIRQATDYSCGPASLLSVLMYWQAADMGESTLYKLVGTSEKDGTTYTNLANGAAQFAKASGLRVEAREHLTQDDLRRYLSDGATVILNLQAWRAPQSALVPWKDIWDDGHFAVLVAMDAEYAYLMDPSASAGYGYIPLSELNDRWHDYDMVDGKKVISDHVGIVIRGQNPLKTNPGPLVRID